MTSARHKRSGIALIAVLVIIAAAGAVVASMTSFSRDGRLAAGNRSALLRGRWAADACAAVAIAQFDKVLGAARSPAQVNAVWVSLDSTLTRVPAPLGGACSAALTAAGTTVSVNRLTQEQLLALVGAVNPAAQRDSLVDALLDWRDADSVVRADGAEADWYAAASRATPRNGPFRNVEEIRMVRGWEHADSIIQLLSIDDYRIVLDRAPVAVLATLDGHPPEAIAWISSHRNELKGQDLSAMLDHLSLAAQRVVASHYAALRAATAVVPEVWYLDCIGHVGNGRGIRVRLSLARAADHVHVTKRWEGFL